MNEPRRSALIPPEHRPILARLAELMLKHALAERAKKTPGESASPPAATEDLKAVKPVSL